MKRFVSLFLLLAASALFFTAAAQCVVTFEGPTDVDAGSSLTITAKITNPIEGMTVTWSSSNGGEFSDASEIEIGEYGTATVTFTTSTSAGVYHVVTAVVTGSEGQELTRGSSAVIHTITGPAAMLEFGAIGHLIAGEPFDVTIRLQDRWANPVKFNAGGVLTLVVDRGDGILGGTLSAAVQVGSNTTTISGVTYSMPDKSDFGLRVNGSGDGSNVNNLVGTRGGLSVDATLTVTATNGTVAKNPDLASYSCASIVQLTATPAAGYQFVNWSGDATGSENPIDVQMLANKYITANFTAAPTPPVAPTPPLGAGTSGDPYQIASLENLYWIADQTNNNGVSFSGTYFLQTANIDASVTTGWFSDGSGGYKGWDPIGSRESGSTQFSGLYDGHGYIISRIFIKRVTPSGLFGEISGASISSLGVTEANISGGEGGGSNNAGGITGFASGSSSIHNCFVTGSILGGEGVGGIVGQTGIEGQSEVGSTISDCYSRASVQAGDRRGGGLVGANYNATIKNCYSTGSVVNGSAAGGLVGTNTGSVTASFWDTETSGQSSSAAGIGKTTAQMKTQTTFTDAGWDFSTIWQMNGANYPELRVFCYTLTITSLNGTVARNPDQASYNSGSAVILTATPATGYTFTGWSGDASGSTNPVDVTMDGNKTVTASFAINTYTLTITATNGSVTKSPNQSTYNHGTTVQLTAIPNAEYQFASWSGDATGTTNPVSVTMDANKNITANFAANTYSIAQKYSLVIQYVLSLPDNKFKKPADQRRSQLSDMFAQSQSKYTAGNSKAAAQYLSQNVTNHLTPQGKNSQNVWVADETARVTLLSMLNDLLDLLQRPQSSGTQSANGSLAAMVEDIPTEYGLSQNYPNPFNPSTTISYSIAQRGFATLKVYNSLGEQVASLVSQQLDPGTYKAQWNASSIASGVYLYRLESNGLVLSRKMLLVK